MLPAVIALGSNLGNREDNLRAAVHDIAALDDVVVTAVSGIVQSHAVKSTGTDADAPAYLNAVMLALPHPRASERAFVIVPWLQVDPDAEIRGHGRIDSLAVAHSGDAWPLVTSALWVHE